MSAALVAVLGIPETGWATSLKEAMEQTYRTNPNLQAARRQLEATNEQVPQARSGWRPDVRVNISGGVQRRAATSAFESTSETTNPRTGELRVEQPVYQGGSTVAATERAKNQVRAERNRLASTAQDVLLRAVQAYMDVWRDQAVLRLNRNNVEVLRERLKATRQRFEVGEVTRTDVAQAESRLARAIADRTAARGDLEASRATYAEVIGSQPEDLTLPDAPEKLPATRTDIVAKARAENPTVQAAGFAEQAARKQVREIVGELLPQVQLVGSVSRSQRQTGEMSETDTAELLARLTVPLYQQGAVSSRVREAKQTASQRQLELASERRTAKQEAISAWEDLQAARSRIDSRQKQVETAEIALEGVTEENRVGERTVLDVLDQEQELLNAQVDLVRARRDLVVASYRVLAAVGDLNPGFVGLDVDPYPAEARYQAVDDRIFGLSVPGRDGDS
ncbi:TolC family outer membrane protein [Limimonas halophila]|uniref:TolC family outer membrane protein n=1 Tax=Limimonas halophila TaxID=1082479 RepID=UPI00159FE141|nr:TolC family outer membrane protein [Limimonas halophila]